MRASREVGTVCAAASVAVAASVIAAEIVHWRASRDGVPVDERRVNPSRGSRSGTRSRSEAIVVLGFPSFRSGRMHPLQKWRTAIAVRSMTPHATSTLIFTGAARPGGRSEAAVMAEYARHEFGIPAERIVLEENARTTWQNIRNSIPYLYSADVIKIASDPTHARKGRRYLLLQNPVLAARLRATDDYRLGERWWLKIPMLGYALTAGRADRGESR